MKYLVLAITLIAGCSSAPHHSRPAYYLFPGESIDLNLPAPVDRAIVSVERGAVDVLFRGPDFRLAAPVTAGQERATIKGGSITRITIEARRASVFTIQTN